MQKPWITLILVHIWGGLSCTTPKYTSLLTEGVRLKNPGGGYVKLLKRTTKEEINRLNFSLNEFSNHSPLELLPGDEVWLCDRTNDIHPQAKGELYCLIRNNKIIYQYFDYYADITPENDINIKSALPILKFLNAYNIKDRQAISSILDDRFTHRTLGSDDSTPILKNDILHEIDSQWKNDANRVLKIYNLASAPNNGIVSIIPYKKGLKIIRLLSDHAVRARIFRKSANTSSMYEITFYLKDGKIINMNRHYL